MSRTIVGGLLFILLAGTATPSRATDLIGAGGSYKVAIAYDPGTMFGNIAVANGTADETVTTGGGKTFNLSLSAITAYDARKLIEVALSTHKVKQVIYNVDFNAFSGPPRQVAARHNASKAIMRASWSTGYRTRGAKKLTSSF